MDANKNARRNSILIAIVVALALVGWMLSGLLTEEQVLEPRTASATEETAMRVSVVHSTARRTLRTIGTSGRTEPERMIELKAETAGRIVALAAERGSAVQAGQRIVTIDIRDRRSQLAEAEALIRQREQGSPLRPQLPANRVFSTHL